MFSISPLLTSVAVIGVGLTTAHVFAADHPAFTVGEREVVATKKQRDATGLKWFIDGNLGVLKDGNRIRLYGANGSKPVRVNRNHRGFAAEGRIGHYQDRK